MHKLLKIPSPLSVFLLALIITVISSLYIVFTKTVNFKSLSEVKSNLVIINSVKDVLKVITTDIYVTDIYEHEVVTTYGFIEFDSKISLITTGVAAVGYDLDSLNVTVDQKEKTIIISNAIPKILYLDTEVKYKDIDESFFSALEKESHTLAVSNSKEQIRQQVLRIVHEKYYNQSKHNLAQQLNYFYPDYQIYIHNPKFYN